MTAMKEADPNVLVGKGDYLARKSHYSREQGQRDVVWGQWTFNNFNEKGQPTHEQKKNLKLKALVIKVAYRGRVGCFELVQSYDGIGW